MNAMLYRRCKGQMMSLSRAMFYILRAQGSSQQLYTQRELCEITHMSLGSVNTAYAQAKRAGYLVDGRLSEKGRAALKPYQVHNAIIMAAGLSSRLHPFPTNVLKVFLKLRAKFLLSAKLSSCSKRVSQILRLLLVIKRNVFSILRKNMAWIL